MAGSTRGASSALTEAGPPDRMMAAGAISCTSSAVMSHGTISEYTCKSRTRRAISCPYCAPKSNTTTFWLVELDDAVLTRRLLLRLYHAARPRLRLHFCLRIRINDCTVSCANPYLSAVHLQYNATQGPCYRLRFALPISNAGKENVRPLWFIGPCAALGARGASPPSTISNPCGVAGLSGLRSRVYGLPKGKT